MSKNKPDKVKDSSPARFRDLGRGYFHREVHLHLIAELLLFGVLVAISAWPMFHAFDAVTNLPF